MLQLFTYFLIKCTLERAWHSDLAETRRQRVRQPQVNRFKVRTRKVLIRVANLSESGSV